MHPSFRFWAPLSAVMTACVGVLAFADVDSWLRPLLVFLFVLIFPGMALVRLLRLREPLLEAALAVGLSLALALLIATVILYAHRLSWQATLAVLIAVTLGGTLVELIQQRGGRPARNSP